MYNTLTHSHSRVPLEILSATFILLNITWKWSKISQNIWRGFVVCLLINTSHSWFQKKCFCKGNISKKGRTLLVALSVNGLNMELKWCKVLAVLILILVLIINDDQDWLKIYLSYRNFAWIRRTHTSDAPLVQDFKIMYRR